MNRRQFLCAAGLGAGAVALPYFLPSGSLFAKTGSQRVGHVVLCLFAGGLRNIEVVHQNEGNLTPVLLEGSRSVMTGVESIPNLNNFTSIQLPLQKYGTLFKEFRYLSGSPGHYNGHAVALTGVYHDTGLNIKQNPPYPTIFEYYRKHRSPSSSALNAWWVSNILGPFVALNYSKFSGYGAQYGANFMSPNALFSQNGYKFIGEMKFFAPEQERIAGEMKTFLDGNFPIDQLLNSFGIVNTEEDSVRLRTFVKRVYEKAKSGGFNNIMDGMLNPTGDMIHITLTEELLTEFKPELTVVNMQDVDICHQNYTSYCNVIQKSDYAIGHLWNTIQSTPGLKDNTVMIVVPEHGRNYERNTVIDSFGRAGIDHTVETNYKTAREIFCMILGPNHIVRQNQIVGTPQNPVGETIDVVPTIATLLGFYDQIPAAYKNSSMISGRFLEEAFL